MAPIIRRWRPKAAVAMACFVAAGLVCWRAEASAAPRLSQERWLQTALLRYRALDASAWRDSLPPASRIGPGDCYAGVLSLARRLHQFGDLAAYPDSASADSVYAGPLVAAVRRFQDRHGLVRDGILGPATFGELAVPPARRTFQIERALEQFRALPELDGGSFLVVNIPSFQLCGFDSAGGDSVPSLRMDVIVGKTGASPTPTMADRVRYVILSPYWHLPRSIILDEILPALEHDPAYLDAQAMELCASANDDISALPLTPENLERLRAGTARVRQRPGPGNTLGLAKFMFPNTNKIYLHGTSDHALFTLPRRDLSHGCVRIGEPEALAEFVLRGEPGWDRERIAAAMDSTLPTRVDLTRPVPILIVYATAQVRPDGQVAFLDDVYGLDREPDLTAPPPEARSP